MSWNEFIENFAATELAMQEYVAGLPLWVNVWRAWMFLVFLLGIVFLFKKREARWLAVAMVPSIIAYNLVSTVVGVGRFPSIAFVVFWSPLAIYFARRWSELESSTTFDRVYRRWFAVTLGTLVISLAFDFYNVAYSTLTGLP